MGRRLVNATGGGGGGTGSGTSAYVSELALVGTQATNHDSAYTSLNKFEVSQVDDNNFIVASQGINTSTNKVLYLAQNIQVDNTGSITASSLSAAENLSGSRSSTTLMGEIAPGVIGSYGYQDWNGSYSMNIAYMKWTAGAPAMTYANAGSHSNDYRQPQGTQPIGLGTFTYASGTEYMAIPGYGTSPSSYAGVSIMSGTSAASYYQPGSYSSTNGNTPALRHFSDTGTRCGLATDHRHVTYQWGWTESYGTSISNLGYTAYNFGYDDYSNLYGLCWLDPAGSGAERAIYYQGYSTASCVTNRNATVVAKSGPQIHPAMIPPRKTTTLGQGSTFRNIFAVGLNTYCINGVIGRLDYDVSDETGKWTILGRISRTEHPGLTSRGEVDARYRIAGSDHQYLVKFTTQKVEVFDLASKLNLSGI